MTHTTLHIGKHLLVCLLGSLSPSVLNPSKKLVLIEIEVLAFLVGWKHIFPIASLKPGWMTFSRVVSLCIPILLITCIACCYEFFNGHYTTLKSFASIRENIGERDVRVRLMLFIISVITPSVNFLFPYMRRWIPVRRKQSQAMSIYMMCFAIIMSGYIWLMLGTSGLCFNVFGYIVILPVLF